MGLFEQIAGAIANPAQLASPDSLQGTISAMQNVVSSYGVSSDNTPIVLSTVGNYVRSALQAVNSQSGNNVAQDLVSQFAGLAANPAAVTALFPPGLFSQLCQLISQYTGLQSAQIESMINSLVPMVLNLLQMGGSALNSPDGINNVLSTFLDADADGDVDIADAIAMAQRMM